MASPSTAAFSFSLVFSLAFAFAVVDNTAVATFSTVSFVGGFVDGGYAYRLGRAFDIKSNLGGYDPINQPLKSKNHCLYNQPLGRRSNRSLLLI